MGATLWRIGVDTPDSLAEDLGGQGAEKTGGRWNRQGRRVVYTSTSVALACLETVVHLKTGGLPLNRYLVRLDVPAAAWDARATFDADANVGWDALPEGKVSLDAGDAWVAAAASPLLVVPSAVVPEEANVVVNPAHPLVVGITARKVRRWHYDPRLLALAAGR